MASLVETLWYKPHPLRWLLWPLSLIYRLISHLRRFFYRIFSRHNAQIPVIVVGNISVGGVGKTPMVIALAQAMTERGLKAGIVSRGYKAEIKKFPYLVSQQDTAREVGDEPLLMARKTACPVVIAPKRMQAVRYLREQCQVDVIISDDGLQHYAMDRAIEIVVIDGTRGLGNGYCLPAGPLRETKSRLQEVDFIVVNEGHWPGAYPMALQPGPFIHLKTGQAIALKHFSTPVAAVAGIGNPERFFSSLKQLGIHFLPYPYADHYHYKSVDMRFKESDIVMTEKDAVKCHAFASDNMFYLPVEAHLSNDFWNALWSHPRLKGICQYDSII